MKNKINIAEILKDCPKGMALDCTMFENVTFVRVDISKKQFPIEIAINGKHSKYLTKEGCFHDVTLLPDAKCVIFPKGKTTWEGFVPPCKFKDGDVCYVKTKRLFEHIIIFKVSEDYNYIQRYVNLSADHLLTDKSALCTHDEIMEMRFATEEEKEKLFKAIKDNGYHWNAETKTLEKIIEPKFKVGDKVQLRENIREKKIIDNVLNNCYTVQGYGVILFTDQDEWELATNKFDITTFKIFDKVLMRSSNAREWTATLYSHYNNNKFYGCGMCCDQCIPYEGNEHLRGTTNNCDNYYKTWK